MPKKDQSFHDYVMSDLFADMPDVRSRAMFGGWGIYKNALMFAIIVDGELYFKVDGRNRAQFEEAGSHPFVFHKPSGGAITMSYWLAPEAAFDNSQLLLETVESAVAAALRSKEKTVTSRAPKKTKMTRKKV